MLRKIYIFYLLIISVGLGENLLFTNKVLATRTPHQYLYDNLNRQRILVIGTGRFIRDYPANEYLINIDPNTGPDQFTDITTPGAIPVQFHGVFDIVIWEYVPGDVLFLLHTIPNILQALRPGGQLIGNLPLAVAQEGDFAGPHPDIQ